MKAAFYKRSAVLILMLGILCVVWLPNSALTSSASGVLVVRFLDVGQGDAIHIMTPDGYEMLIDGGASALVLRALATGRSPFDHFIDVVIATHPDTDHVGGLVDVLERYQVGMILESNVTHDALAASAFTQAALVEGAELMTAQAGQIIQLGASTTVRVLSPRGDTTNWQSNNASVVVQVIYGDIEFMLTGDASANIEDFLVDIYKESLESDVLKLGHHGSKTSTSELFLDTVQPRFAVVSAGADNRYGHPNVEVMDRVSTRNIQSFNTATAGTISFVSDGVRVWVEE